MNKKDKVIKFHEELEELVIVAANGLSAISLPLVLVRSNLASELAKRIPTTKGRIVIDDTELFLNKTIDLERLLKHNLTINEIESKRKESIRMAQSKLGINSALVPKSITGTIDLLVKPIKKDKENANVRITDTLKSAKAPIFLYSCGINDLISLIGHNPNNIPLSNSINKEKYANVIKQCKDPSIIEEVLSRVNRNFNTILEINPNTRLIALGWSIPSTSNKSKEFSQLVDKYNNGLKRICEYHNQSFIDIKSINETKRTHHELITGNFGTTYVCNEIIKKLSTKIVSLKWNMNTYQTTDLGLEGWHHDAIQDEQDQYTKPATTAYQKKRKKETLIEKRDSTDIISNAYYRSKRLY